MKEGLKRGKYIANLCLYDARPSSLRNRNIPHSITLYVAFICYTFEGNFLETIQRDWAEVMELEAKNQTKEDIKYKFFYLTSFGRIELVLNILSSLILLIMVDVVMLRG